MSRLEKAYDLAKEVRLRAYAPYSKFKVGATVAVKGGELYTGCNVENASYGGCVCAERSSILKAISELGKCEFEFMVLVTDTDPVAAPCGFCRQIMAEFCAPDFQIHIANLKGVQKIVSFKELLPMPFNSF